VLNNAAMANLRGHQANLFNSGSDLLLRGAMAQLGGFFLRQSGGITLHTKGTGTAYQVNLLAGYPKGSTAIAVDTGTNMILKGDIITNTQAGRDANKYVSGTDGTTTLLTLNKPGIQVAWVDNDTLAIGANYTGNFAFDRSAVWLAARPPAMPSGGDDADDTMIIQDPVSGLMFEIRMYRQYHRVAYEIGMAWGLAVVKPEFVATLLG
jgi:hypothetical protein